MAVALALWSLKVEAGESNAQELTPPAEIRITNIALGGELADEKGRTSVKLVYIAVGDSDDEEDEEDEDEEKVPNPTETVLCTLIPGQIEQVTVNIVLPAERPVVFATTGKNTVHLTGNYIDQMLPDEPPSDDEVVSDDEMYGAETGEEDEDEADGAEVEVEAKQPSVPESKKRRLEEDAGDEKLSKKERKKQNKKQKAESGEAIPVAEKEQPATQHEKTEKPKKGKEVEKKEQKASGEEQTLAGGVKIKDHKIGQGPKAKQGDTVSMRYVGKLTNGKVFDSNTKGKFFTFELGAGDVIKGWDVGIVGMQAGGERLLTIPPSMGYGKRAQSDIPANSTLIFEVKLASIKA